MVLERGTTDAVRILGSHGLYSLPDVGQRQLVLKVQRLRDGLEYCKFLVGLQFDRGTLVHEICSARDLPADKMLEAFLDQQGAIAL